MTPLSTIKREVLFLIIAIVLCSASLGSFQFYQSQTQTKRQLATDHYHLGTLREIEAIKTELFALQSVALSTTLHQDRARTRTIGASQIIEQKFQVITYLQGRYANPAFSATLDRMRNWHQTTLSSLEKSGHRAFQLTPATSQNLISYYNALEQLEKLHAVIYKQQQISLAKLNARDTIIFLGIFAVILIFGGILICRTLTRLRNALDGQKKAERSLTQLNEELERRIKERSNELLKTQGHLLRSERLATIGQLTATVSHELRNPLGTIQSSFYIVESHINADAPKAARAVERIHRNIARCVRIIEELLDYTRVHEPQPRPVKINAWCDTVLDEFMIPDNIRIRTDYLSETTVELDPDRMYQVLSNLLLNACQAVESRFGEEEGGVVTVSTRRSGDRFWITVSDNGPGVPEDIRGRIFDPLYSTKTYGVGLGLPLVKQVVEDHHGAITLQGAEEGGAAFRIDLPIKQLKPDETAA